MANNDTIKKTIIVTLLLCFACSVVVSSAAVLLRPMQIANQELDFKRNILAAANMLDGRDIETVFAERIVTRVIRLETGSYADDEVPDGFQNRAASRDPSLSTNLNNREDIAGINRREDYSLVYLVEDSDGNLEKIILPVRGYGLWSTMWGFIALEADANTIMGIGFYEHGETPGLGGEIDNPRWQANWEGKKIYDEDGSVAFTVLKGSVDSGSPQAQYQVDGLSGATLTARGVHNMMQFWMGDKGFRPFLMNLQDGEA
ncbi:Na(+)-translocating NADH-quinone reductase subunit C [Marinimicrobium alkaliphilum]|uniref:Na(+)-translocating NADH-quinone reductase subunit C n=1 Tax=Marinimicrobium alkaliphilum TaxID=2202654 RepID=UPI000DB96E23|nr:Na(+)-translocating NADH-quinone reductase subunit C [Marinimicrobium alkaliphilum]